MSKAILVIDMPNYCSECILCRENYFCHEMCIAADERIFTSEKPDWCPLKSVPEKYDMETAITHDLDYDGEYEYGYNQCINEILGE